MKRFRLSKLEVLTILAILAVLALLMPPTPHWKETFRHSCHLCGNRRYTADQFRWWRLDSRIEEMVTDYPIPEGHTHDWWQYSHAYLSWSGKWAASNSSRYRDGRHAWP